MSRKRSALTNWSEYLALRGISTFLHAFDVDQNLKTAAGIGSVFARLSPRHRRRAERNLALSFPEWSETRVREVAERSIQYMFQLFMVDALVTPRLVTPASWARYVRLGEISRVVDQLVAGRPAILVTGHCGNWELLGYVLAMLGFPLTALARPVDNPLINRWLLGIREARGLHVITKFGATTILPDLLRSGGTLGFIADQDAGEQAMFVPFFGRLASSYKSIALLAMHHEVPIATGVARRVGDRMRYVLEAGDFMTPDDWVDRPDPLFYITARYSRAMEQMIRVAPEQYLWLHRRWKTRPRHERRGEPVPRRLRQKLESLPWMTQAEMDRLITLSEDPKHKEVGRD